jgi:FixJ family two-component response regulator
MSLPRRVVTVIDDDRAVLKAIQRLLSAKGFDVEAFSSAETFLAHAAASKTTCLVLDIDLPGMSGIDLGRQLSNASGPRLPIVYITALDDEATRKEALHTGYVAYLRKPFLAELLISAIDKATGYTDPEPLPLR